jgi:GR25 family glycosyltransferase involved in LPS biosynthesis
MERLELELIYVLGVPDRFRGKELVNSLLPYGITCKVISGINSNSISPEQLVDLVNQKAASIVLGRKISLGEICCSMVHLAAYKNFLETSAEWVLILEDDAVILRDLEEIFTGLITLESPTILKLSEAAPETSIVKKIASEDLRVSALGFRKLRFPTNMAHAYIINREAAKLAIESCSGMKIHFTADWPYLWDNRVTFWQSNNSFFVQQGESLIDADSDRFRITNDESFRRSSWKRIKENILDLSGLNSVILSLYGGNGVEYFKSRPLRKLKAWVS